VSPPNIRPYAGADRAACALIFARAWASAFPHIPRAIDPEAFDAETRDEIILVAERDGRICGFASLYAPENFLHHLYIEPVFHRSGVGAALVMAARAITTGPLSLKCSVGNLNARAFYARLGFTEGERGEDHLGPWVRVSAPEARPDAR
jgi:GNAT superfamily N-acetyltransferase